MNILKVVLLLATFNIACVSSTTAQKKEADSKKDNIAKVEKRMIGKWLYDREKSLAAAKKAGLDEEIISALKRPADGSSFVEFLKDGECTLGRGAKKKEFWEISDIKTKNKKQHFTMKIETGKCPKSC